MDTFTECICTDGRNHIDCERHRCAELLKVLNTPIWIEIAWELDLNWTGSAGELFWQHNRLSLWKFDQQPPTEEVLETKHVE